MLTRELMTFRTVGTAVKIAFINTADEKLLDFAAGLIACHQSENGAPVPMAVIDEQTAPLLRSMPDQKLAAGLNKTVRDRCVFSLPDDHDYAAARREIFLNSAAALRNAADQTGTQEYLDGIIAGLTPEPAQLAAGDIYPDLPGNELMIKGPKLFPRELLERYNCAQVQSLLLYAENLEITVEGASPEQLRRLCKYLKFFRLLAMISVAGRDSGRVGGLPKRLKLKIDGPAGLFEQTRKYGLQLASFFPVLPDLPKWKMTTALKIKDRELRLSLDERCGLKGHYRNFSAYVPEEIKMFGRLFREKVADWQTVDPEPLLQPRSGELIFPDMTFKHASGITVHLELFHRWHSGALLRRLEYCRNKPDTRLLIGVDRSLLRDPATAALLDDENGYFRHAGFLFRDFPGVDRVVKHLN